MPKFLTDEWAQAVREAVNADEEMHEAAQKVDICVSQTTTDVPDRGDVVYWFAFHDGAMENGFGPAPRPADADLLMTHATAKALYSGATKMQVAFMQGKVKAKGNMAKMLKSQSTLNGIMPIIDRVTSEY